MIYLTYQNFSHLDPENLSENENLWSEWDMQEWGRLKIPKRRMEWLASRMVIKKLIKAVLPDQHGRDMNQIEVHKEPSGAPYIVINHQRVQASVSLSHSNGFVLAACSPASLPLGVDVERIEPRAGVFLEDFFTRDEISQVKKSNGKEDLITTLFWSGKEAVLKANTSGLSQDTRRINLRCPPIDESFYEWNDLLVDDDGTLYPAPHLVWRREEQMILTVCWAGNPALPLIWVEED